MDTKKRELEILSPRALMDSPNSLERKYMSLYDEKVRLEYIIQDYERQLSDQDRDIFSYRKRHNGATAKIAERDRVISAYEDKLQQMARTFGSLKDKYEQSVKRYQECDKERREKELENLELIRESGELKEEVDRLNKMLEEQARDCEEMRQKSNEVFMAGQDLQEKYDHAMEVNKHLESEKTRLEAENSKYKEQLANDKRTMFGSKSDRTENIFNGQPVQEDPTAEDASFEEENPKDAEDKTSETGSNSFSAKTATEKIAKRLNKSHGKKRNGGNSKTDAFEKFKDLEQVYHFERDAEKDADPGFRLLRFEDHWDVRETKPVNYVYHTLTPVYEEKMDDGFRRLVSVPMKLNLWPGSYISSPLTAKTVTEKFVRGVTLYAMEQEYKRRGVNLGREFLSRGIIHFSEGVFKELCEHFGIKPDELFFVQQMDETWLTQVLWSQADKENGKKNGAKGILWERISGELSDGPQIVLFTYSKTRSVEFLKKALKSMAGYLCSDAYGAYFAMEKIKGKELSVSSCWMHCRKYFAIAVMAGCNVLKLWDGKTEEEILEQPAVKALLTANRIFEEDTKLKGLSSEERYEKRLKKAAPIVDEFFDLVDSIDLEVDGMYEALRKAVVYARNQKEHLKVFLEDGEIPIDNGHSERHIKYVAKVRKSCLFAYSEVGAVAFGRCMSVVCTAIENGADPFYYVKFIVEEYAKLEQEAVADRKAWFDQRMPWSPMYIAWERGQRAIHADEYVPESELPRAGERVNYKGSHPEGVTKDTDKKDAA